MDKAVFKELLEFLVIAVPLWGVWFTVRGGLRSIELVLRTRLERMEYVLGHKLIRVESAICLEAGKTRRHTTDIFVPKSQPTTPVPQQATQPPPPQQPPPSMLQPPDPPQPPDHNDPNQLKITLPRS